MAVLLRDPGGSGHGAGKLCRSGRDGQPGGGEHHNFDRGGAAARARARSCPRAARSRISSANSRTATATAMATGRGVHRRLGSGFVISEDGFIVTNNHVIESADEIIIEFFSVQGAGSQGDRHRPETPIIALLKVEADEPLKFVSFGDSDTARVGDWVMAMGNPLGQGFSVSAGIVSQRGRALSGVPMTITSRPTRRSTGAIPAGRCSTWMAR